MRNICLILRSKQGRRFCLNWFHILCGYDLREGWVNPSRPLLCQFSLEPERFYIAFRVSVSRLLVYLLNWRFSYFELFSFETHYILWYAWYYSRYILWGKLAAGPPCPIVFYHVMIVCTLKPPKPKPHPGYILLHAGVWGGEALMLYFIFV